MELQVPIKSEIVFMENILFFYFNIIMICHCKYPACMKFMEMGKIY